MDSEADRLARVVLAHTVEPGTPDVAEAVAEWGAPAVAEMLAADRGPGPESPQTTRPRAVNAEQVLEHAERQGIRFLIPGDPEWPASLNELSGTGTRHSLGGVPLGLWVRGEAELAATCRDSVGVVGSRAATSYGLQLAHDIAYDLARHDHTVVSGGAFGIDQAAHRGALNADGITVAVFASGLDRPYPEAHRDLFDTITARGGLAVSEAPIGAAPTRLRFISRSRIIAAAATGTVVPEAAVRSGALNTAAWAADLGRPVMAVPGPVTSAASAGVHQLLRAGAASLVTSGPEVRETLPHDAGPAGGRQPSSDESYVPGRTQHRDEAPGFVAGPPRHVVSW